MSSHSTDHLKTTFLQDPEDHVTRREASLRSAVEIPGHPNQMSSKRATHVSRSYAGFCELLTLAEDKVAVGDLAAAVALAQIAARYAFPGRGLFGSQRLERLLLEVGKQIPCAPVCVARHQDEPSRNILHVLSYARPVGGDSRCVWRWIQEDPSNRHSVAITSQADIEGIYGDIPEILKQSAQRSGGFLRTLRAPTSKPLEQARELRALCSEMDLVVLHLFPYDVIPVLALAAGCDSAKTLFVNVCDHAFWIGASVAHWVVHLRRQSPFLTKRRGLNPEQCSILPIPLFHPRSAITSVQAKRALGLEPDVVVLLTIASPFKYSSPSRISFLDLVTPVLAKFPQAILIAVGPDPKGAWQSASIQTKGRIVPLGTQWDNSIFYAAADVYLDSVPFSSTTSLLEAGSHGVPLLGYMVPDAELRLLGPGSPGLDNAMEVANDEESYRTLLTALITEPEFRRRSGRRVQEQILSLHTGSNWTNALHALYERVEQCNTRGCLIEDNDTFEVSALNSALLQLYAPMDVGRLITHHIETLRYWSRLSVAWCLYFKGFGLRFLNLLPPPTNVIVRRVGRWAKRTARRLLGCQWAGFFFGAPPVSAFHLPIPRRPQADGL